MMEEIEYKLKQKNTVIIVNAIAKLVDTVRDKNESNPAQIHQLPELKLLWQKCEDADPVISITACQGIITLVEYGVLLVVPTLSHFISALSSAVNYIGIINAIGSLLILEMKMQISEKRNYQCPFALQVPQHPLLILLRHKNDVWPDILSQIQFLLKNNDETVSKNSIELLRPLLLYVLCDPAHPGNLPSVCRRELWELLMLNFHRTEVKTFLMESFLWLQVENEQQSVSTSQLLLPFFMASQQSGNMLLCAALAPSVASVTVGLVKGGHDPRNCLAALAMITPPEAVSTTLTVLVEGVVICPAAYLYDYFATCKSLVTQKSTNVMAAKMLTCALLQWLIYPTYLAGEALQLANDIHSYINANHVWGSHTGRLFTNKWFSNVRVSDNRVNTAVQLCRLSEQWQSNPSTILQWLKKIATAPSCVTDKLRWFISALFIHTFDQEAERQECLSVLLKMVDKNNELSSSIMTLILYKLAEERDPTMQLELLQNLPAMAVQKENIPLIVHTLETLKNKQALKNLIVDLYTRLWKIECRCYPYLQKLLQEPIKDGDEFWELNVAKALSMKQICETRPAQHGEELVSLLSDILNKCSGVQGSLPSSIAIEAIAALCSADIVDITTTWKSLAPRLSRDKRPAVIRSLCKLFSLVPTLRSSGTAYENLVNEVVAKLWSYITTSENLSVVKAAFEALSKFELAQLSLKTLPECYRQNLKLPREYAKTPVDAARRPEDVLPYIPSECWGQMLLGVKSEALESAGLALRQWLNTEFLCFRGGVYHLPPGRSEPDTYSNLPHHCVCRGVAGLAVSLSKQSDLPEKERLVARECLRVLGYNYPKPLPPLNWNFLDDFINCGKDIRESALTVASKQSASSPSARKFLEDFMCNLTTSLDSIDDISTLFSNLSHLCRGLPPNVLKPFIEKSLLLALEHTKIAEGEDNSEMQQFFNKMLSEIKAAMQKENIHDANRTMVAIVVESLLDKLDAEHPMFASYVDCVTELPTKNIERMSSPSNWWEVTAEKLRLALHIRSAMARRTDTDVPLTWLNECIDATAPLTGEHTTVLKVVATLMADCWDRDTNCLWTLELMGQIQKIVSSQEDTSNQQAVILLWDILILTVIAMCGNYCFLPSLELIATNREHRLQLFPTALPCLLSMERWKDMLPQMTEWLFHMSKSSVASPLYASVFYDGLVSLHHTKYFKENTVWMKTVNLRSPRNFIK